MDWKKQIGYYDYLACVTSTTSELWPTTRLEAAIFLVDLCFLRRAAGETFPGFDRVVEGIRKQDALFRRRTRELVSELRATLLNYQRFCQPPEWASENFSNKLIRLALAAISRIRFAEIYLGGSEFSEAYLRSLLWDELPDIWYDAGEGIAPYAATWLDDRRECLSSSVQSRYEETGRLPKHAAKHLAACPDCRTTWEQREETARFMQPFLPLFGKMSQDKRWLCPSIRLLRDFCHLQASDLEVKLARNHLAVCSRCRTIVRAYGKRIFLHKTKGP